MIKKAMLIIFISALPLFTIIGCSEDTDDHSSKRFITPNRYNIDKNIYVIDPIPDPPITETYVNKFKPYRIDPKLYNIAGHNDSGDNRNVIIYHGSPNKTTYFAIALDNRHAVTPPDFSVRIYFAYSGSISSSGTAISIPAGNYTIQIIDGGSTYTSTTDPLNIIVTDITEKNDNVYNQNFTKYTVDFTTNNITVSTTDALPTSITINIGDTLTAHKHPDPYAND